MPIEQNAGAPLENNAPENVNPNERDYMELLRGGHSNNVIYNAHMNAGIVPVLKPLEHYAKKYGVEPDAIKQDYDIAVYKKALYDNNIMEGYSPSVNTPTFSAVDGGAAWFGQAQGDYSAFAGQKNIIKNPFGEKYMIVPDSPTGVKQVMTDMEVALKSNKYIDKYGNERDLVKNFMGNARSHSGTGIVVDFKVNDDGVPEPFIREVKDGEAIEHLENVSPFGTTEMFGNDLTNAMAQVYDKMVAPLVTDIAWIGMEAAAMLDPYHDFDDKWMEDDVFGGKGHYLLGDGTKSSYKDRYKRVENFMNKLKFGQDEEYKNLGLTDGVGGFLGAAGATTGFLLQFALTGGASAAGTKYAQLAANGLNKAAIKTLGKAEVAKQLRGQMLAATRHTAYVNSAFAGLQMMHGAKQGALAAGYSEEDANAFMIMMAPPSFLVGRMVAALGNKDLYKNAAASMQDDIASFLKSNGVASAKGKMKFSPGAILNGTKVGASSFVKALDNKIAEIGTQGLKDMAHSFKTIVTYEATSALAKDLWDTGLFTEDAFGIKNANFSNLLNVGNRPSDQYRYPEPEYPNGRPQFNAGLFHKEDGSWGLNFTTQGHILESAASMAIGSGIMGILGGTFLSKTNDGKNPAIQTYNQQQAINKHIIKKNGSTADVVDAMNKMMSREHPSFGFHTKDRNGKDIPEDQIGKVESQAQYNYNNMLKEVNLRASVYNDSGLKDLYNKWTKGSLFRSGKDKSSRVLSSHIHSITQIENLVRKGIDLLSEKSDVAEKLAKAESENQPENIKKPFIDRMAEIDAEYNAITSPEGMNARYKDALMRAHQRETYMEAVLRGDKDVLKSIDELTPYWELVGNKILSHEKHEMNNKHIIDLEAQRIREHEEWEKAMEEDQSTRSAFNKDILNKDTLDHSKDSEILDRFDEIVARTRSGHKSDEILDSNGFDSTKSIMAKMNSFSVEMYERAEAEMEKIFGDQLLTEDVVDSNGKPVLDSKGNVKQDTLFDPNDPLGYIGKIESKSDQAEIQGLVDAADRIAKSLMEMTDNVSGISKEPRIEKEQIREDVYLSDVVSSPEGELSISKFSDFIISVQENPQAYKTVNGVSALRDKLDAIAEKQRMLVLQDKVYRDIKKENYPDAEGKEDLLNPSMMEVSLENPASINNYLKTMYSLLESTIKNNEVLMGVDRIMKDSVYRNNNIKNRIGFLEPVIGSILTGILNTKNVKDISASKRINELKAEFQEAAELYHSKYETVLGKDRDKKTIYSEKDIKDIDDAYVDANKKLVALEESIHRVLRSDIKNAIEIYEEHTFAGKAGLNDPKRTFGRFALKLGNGTFKDYNSGGKYIINNNPKQKDVPYTENGFLFDTAAGKGHDLGILTVEFTNYYNNLFRLSPLKFHTAYKEMMDLMVKNMKAEDNSLLYYAENAEQIETVRHLTSFLVDSRNIYEIARDHLGKVDKNAPFGIGGSSQWKKNVMFVQGYAGTGKSMEVLKMALHMHDKLARGEGKVPGKIKIVSLTKNIEQTNKIIDKLKSLHDKNENRNPLYDIYNRTGGASISLETFLSYPDKDMSGVEIVVLDEATRLTSAQLEKIYAKAKINSDDKIKIIALGDNSQLSGDVTKPALDAPISYGVEISTPMTQIMRSDVIDIALMQDAYREVVMTLNGEQRSPIMPSTRYDKNRTAGVFIRDRSEKSEKDQIAAFVADIKDANLIEKPLYIVFSDAQAAKLADRISSEYSIPQSDIINYIKPIDFKSENSILGLEHDRVYVGIRNNSDVGMAYNRVMLTSLSRAEKFVDVMIDSDVIHNPSKMVESLETSESDIQSVNDGIRRKFENLHNEEKVIVEHVENNALDYGDTKKAEPKETKKPVTKKPKSSKTPVVESLESISKGLKRNGNEEDIVLNDRFTNDPTGENDVTVVGITKTTVGGKTSYEITIEDINGDYKTMSLAKFNTGKYNKVVPVFDDVISDFTVSSKDLSDRELSRVRKWAKDGISASGTYSYSVDPNSAKGADMIKTRKWAIENLAYGKVPDAINIVFNPEKSLWNNDKSTLETFKNVISYEVNLDNPDVFKAFSNALGKDRTPEEIKDHALISTAFQPDSFKGKAIKEIDDMISSSINRIVASGKGDVKLVDIARDIASSLKVNLETDAGAHEVSKMIPFIKGIIGIRTSGNAPVVIGKVNNMIGTTGGRVEFNEKTADHDGYHKLEDFLGNIKNGTKQFHAPPTVKKFRHADEMERFINARQKSYIDKHGSLANKHFVGAESGIFEPGYYVVYQYVKGGPVGAFKVRSKEIGHADVKRLLLEHLDPDKNPFGVGKDVGVWQHNYWTAINSFIKANRYHFFKKTIKDGIESYKPVAQYAKYIKYRHGINSKGHKFNSFELINEATSDASASFIDNVKEFAEVIGSGAVVTPKLRDFDLLKPGRANGEGGDLLKVLETNVKDINSPMMLVDESSFGGNEKVFDVDGGVAKKSEPKSIDYDNAPDYGNDASREHYDDNDGIFMAEELPGVKVSVDKGTEIDSSELMDSEPNRKGKKYEGLEYKRLRDAFGSESVINDVRANLQRELLMNSSLNPSYNTGSGKLKDSPFNVYEKFKERALAVADKEYVVSIGGESMPIKIKDMTAKEFMAGMSNRELKSDYIYYKLGNPNEIATDGASMVYGAMIKNIFPAMSIAAFEGNLRMLHKDKSVAIEKDGSEINIGDSSIRLQNEQQNPFDSFSSFVKFAIQTTPYNTYSVVNGERVARPTKANVVEKHAYNLILDSAIAAKYPHQSQKDLGLSALEIFGHNILNHANAMSRHGSSTVSNTLYSIYDHIFRSSKIDGLGSKTKFMNEQGSGELPFSMMEYATERDRIINDAKSKNNFKIDGAVVSEPAMIDHISNKGNEMQSLIAALYHSYGSIIPKNYDIVKISGKGGISKNTWFRFATRSQDYESIKNEFHNQMIKKITEQTPAGMQVKREFIAQLHDTYEEVTYTNSEGSTVSLKNATKEDVAQIRSSPGNTEVRVSESNFGTHKNGFRVENDGVYRVANVLDGKAGYKEKIISFEGNKMKATDKYDMSMASAVNKFFGVRVPRGVANMYFSNKTEATNIRASEAQDFIGKSLSGIKIDRDGFATIHGTWFSSFGKNAEYDNTLKLLIETREAFDDYGAEPLEYEAMEVQDPVHGETKDQTHDRVVENMAKLPTKHYHINRDLAILTALHKGNNTIKYHYSVRQNRKIYRDTNSGFVYDLFGRTGDNSTANDMVSRRFFDKLEKIVGFEKDVRESDENNRAILLNKISRTISPYVDRDGMFSRILNPLLDSNNKDVVMRSITTLDGIKRGVQGRGYGDMSMYEYMNTMLSGYSITNDIKARDHNEVSFPLATQADAGQPVMVHLEFRRDKDTGKDNRLHSITPARNGKDGEVHQHWENRAKFIWDQMRIRKNMQENSIDRFISVLSPVVRGMMDKKIGDFLDKAHASGEYYSEPSHLGAFIKDQINTNPAVKKELSKHIRRNLVENRDYFYDKETGDIRLGNDPYMEFKDNGAGENRNGHYSLRNYKAMEKFMKEVFKAIPKSDQLKRREEAMYFLRSIHGGGIKTFVSRLFESNYQMPENAHPYGGKLKYVKREFTDEEAKRAESLVDKNGKLTNPPFYYMPKKAENGKIINGAIDYHPLLESKYYADFIGRSMVDDLVMGTPTQSKSAADYYSRAYLALSPGQRLATGHRLGMQESHDHVTIADEGFMDLADEFSVEHKLTQSMFGISGKQNSIDGISIEIGIMSLMRYYSTGGEYGPMHHDNIFASTKPVYVYVDHLTGKRDVIKNSVASTVPYREHSLFYRNLEQRMMSRQSFLDNGKEITLYDKLVEFDFNDHALLEWMADNPVVQLADGSPLSVHKTYFAQIDPLSTKKGITEKVNGIKEDHKEWVPNEVFTDHMKIQLDVNKDFRQDDVSHASQLQSEMSVGEHNNSVIKEMQDIMSNLGEAGMKDLIDKTYDKGTNNISPIRVERYLRNIGMSAASSQGVIGVFAKAIGNFNVSLSLPFLRERLIPLATNKLNEYIKPRYNGGSYVQQPGKLIDVWRRGRESMTLLELEYRAQKAGIDVVQDGALEAYAESLGFIKDVDGLREMRHYYEDGRDLNDVAEEAYNAPGGPGELYAEMRADANNLKFMNRRFKEAEFQEGLANLKAKDKEYQNRLTALRAAVLKDVSRTTRAESMMGFKNYDKFGFHEDAAKGDGLYYKDARVFKMLSYTNAEGEIVRYDHSHDYGHIKVVDESGNSVSNGRKVEFAKMINKDFGGDFNTVDINKMFDPQLISSLKETQKRKAAISGEAYDEAAPVKMIDVLNHMEKFIANLDHMYGRVPASSTASGGIARTIEFFHDGANTMVIPSKKNALDNSDYDIDELRVYFRDIDNAGSEINAESLELGKKQDALTMDEAQITSKYSDKYISADKNKMVNLMMEYYFNPKNIERFSRPVSTSVIDKIVNGPMGVDKTPLRGSLYSTDLNSKMFKNFMEGADTIGIFALAIKSYNRLYNYGLNSKKKFSIDFVDSFGNKKSYDSFTGVDRNGNIESGENTGDVLAELLQAAVDNGKQFQLAGLNANPQTANIISAMAIVGVSPAEISATINSPHAKRIFDDYSNSRNIDRPTTPIGKVIDSHLSTYTALLERLNDPSISNAVKINTIQMLNKNYGLRIPYFLGKVVEGNMQSQLDAMEYNAFAAEEYSKIKNQAEDKSPDIWDSVIDENGVEHSFNVIEELTQIKSDMPYDHNKAVTHVLNAIDQINNIKNFSYAGEAIRRVGRVLSIAQGIKTTDFEIYKYLDDYNQFTNPSKRYLGKRNEPAVIGGKEVFLDKSNMAFVESDFARYSNTEKDIKRFVDISDLVKNLPDIKKYVDIANEQQKSFGKTFIFDHEVTRKTISSLLDNLHMNNISFKNQYTNIKNGMNDLIMSMYMYDRMGPGSDISLSVSKTGDGKDIINKKVHLGSPGERLYFHADFVRHFEEMLDNPESIIGSDRSKLNLFNNNQLIRNLEVIISEYGNKRIVLRDSIYMSDELKAQIEADFINIDEATYPGFKNRLIADQMIVNGFRAGKGSLSEMIHPDEYIPVSEWMNEKINDMNRNGANSDIAKRIEDFADSLLTTDYVRNMIPSPISKRNVFASDYSKSTEEVFEIGGPGKRTYDKGYVIPQPSAERPISEFEPYIKTYLNMRNRGSNEHVLKLIQAEDGSYIYKIVNNMFSGLANNIHPGAETTKDVFKFISGEQLSDLKDGIPTGGLRLHFDNHKSHKGRYVLPDGLEYLISREENNSTGKSGVLIIRRTQQTKTVQELGDLKMSEKQESGIDQYENGARIAIFMGKIKQSFPNIKFRLVTNKEMLEALKEDANSDPLISTVPFGYVTNNREILINKERDSLQAPLHEYSHIFSELLKYSDPVVYERLLNDAKRIEIEVDGETTNLVDYLRTHERYKNKDENALADEAMAFYAGAHGENKLIEKLAELDIVLEPGSPVAKGLFEKTRDIFNTLWDKVFTTLKKFLLLKDDGTFNVSKEFANKSFTEIMDRFVNSVLKGELISDISSENLAALRHGDKIRNGTYRTQKGQVQDMSTMSKASVQKEIDAIKKEKENDC